MTPEEEEVTAHTMTVFTFQNSAALAAYALYAVSLLTVFMNYGRYVLTIDQIAFVFWIAFSILGEKKLAGVIAVLFWLSAFLLILGATAAPAIVVRAGP